MDMTTNWLEQRFEMSQQLLSTCVSDGIVILDLAHGTYLGLDRVASSIWPLVTTQASGREIVDQICSQFDVPEPTAMSDVGNFLRELVERRLIRPMDTWDEHR